VDRLPPRRTGRAGAQPGAPQQLIAPDAGHHGTMTRVTSSQPHRNGRHAKLEPPPPVRSIPLSPERPPQPSEASLGDLVREATTHFSTLIRSEVELAKAELTQEVRKGVKGSIFFVVALAILIFSLVFLFITLGEVLDVWLPRWAAFSIVFGVMVLAAALFALLGWRRVRSIHKPERTITSVKETGEVFTHLRPNHQHEESPRDGHRPAGPLLGDEIEDEIAPSAQAQRSGRHGE
jgi:uncharacterized membrane protein YqjE